MAEPIFSRCGMRCDLCLLYRPNVEACDRRAEVCRVFAKAFPGYAPAPEQTICDGCLCEKENARRLDPDCKTRQCVLQRGLRFCGDCGEYPCACFPAEPSDAELAQKIDVEKRWTRDEERLMEAYNCKRNMDEYRKDKSHSS